LEQEPQRRQVAERIENARNALGAPCGQIERATRRPQSNLPPDAKRLLGGFSEIDNYRNPILKLRAGQVVKKYGRSRWALRLREPGQELVAPPRGRRHRHVLHLNVLAGLVFDALADSSPVENRIAKYADARLVARIAEEYRHGRCLLIVTTNLDSGVPVICNIGAIAESKRRAEAVGLIRRILRASASVSGLFSPVMIDVTVDGVPHQEMHVGGGAPMQTLLYPAADAADFFDSIGHKLPSTSMEQHGRI